jgi:hypothetical protein
MTLGGAASETVSALKASPSLLVIVLLNILMVGGLGYFMLNAQANNKHLIELLIAKCADGHADAQSQ